MRQFAPFHTTRRGIKASPHLGPVAREELGKKQKTGSGFRTRRHPARRVPIPEPSLKTPQASSSDNCKFKIQYPAAECDALKPAFDKVVESLGVGRAEL
jgi:hypothetical protein